MGGAWDVVGRQGQIGRQTEADRLTGGGREGGRVGWVRVSIVP